MINEIIFWALLILVGLSFAYLAFRGKSYQYFFVIVTLLSSGLLYWHWGSWSRLNEFWKLQASSQQVSQLITEHQRDPQKLLNRYRQLVAERPHDDKAWYYLGKLYMEQNAYADAVNAYRQSLQLQQKDLNYQTAYAEALFFAEGNHLNEESRQVLQAVVTKNPNAFIAQNLLAIDAYQNRDYNNAIQRWERLAVQLPPNSENAKALYAMIAKAQELAKK